MGGMRYFLASFVAVAWALWFGGLVALFVFMATLRDSMHADYHAIFDAIAPRQFAMSERFAIVVGGFALIVTLGLRVLTPHRAVTGLFVILMAAGAIAVAKPMLISPRMLDMIHSGDVQSADFRRLHGLYMLASSLEVLILLIAGFFLPAVMALVLRPKVVGSLADRVE